MKTVDINNNISMHYIEMKKLKTNVVGMYIARELSEDEASKNAVLANVLKSGTKEYPTMLNISEKLDDLYGAKLNSGILKMGDNQVIYFAAETICDDYAPNGEKLTKGLCDMLFGMAFKPLVEDNSFKKDIVDREKNNVKLKIASIINDKRSYAKMKCESIMASGDRFAVCEYGDIENVDKVDEKTLYEHYKNIITNSRIDIFVAGSCDILELQKTAKDYIKDYSFEDYKKYHSEKIAQKNEVKRVSEKMEVTQGKISVGFTTGITANDEDYPAMLVANSIFGAGTHSKLFNNVREKLSLAYYASSGLNKFKGIMSVNVGVEFENFQKAYDETMLQFEEVKKGNITDDELNFSVSTIINSLDSNYDSQIGMQTYALGCLYLNTNPDIEEFKEKIKKVTKEDCVKVFNKVKENTVYFLEGIK